MRTEKRCPTCGETKPLDQFCVNRARSDGRNWQCKPCGNVASKAYQARERERQDA